MKTILIASHESSYHLEALVKQLGYRADVVKDGNAALAYLRGHTPDLILADAKLPEISGGSLAYRSKKITRLRKLPICLLIDTYDAKGRAEALQPTIDGIILKPYSASFVKEILRKLIPQTTVISAYRASSPASFQANF